MLILIEADVEIIILLETDLSSDGKSYFIDRKNKKR
jgi:uncharacterized ferredoxin-like protein